MFRSCSTILLCLLVEVSIRLGRILIYITHFAALARWYDFRWWGRGLVGSCQRRHSHNRIAISLTRGCIWCLKPNWLGTQGVAHSLESHAEGSLIYALALDAVWLELVRVPECGRDSGVESSQLAFVARVWVPSSREIVGSHAMCHADVVGACWWMEG